MIEGYLGRESVFRGEGITVHVSTTSTGFRVDCYRVGRNLEFVRSFGWFPGVAAPAPPHPDGDPQHASPAVDWDWPAYELPLTNEWEPGMYLAILVEDSDDQQPHDRPNEPDHVAGSGREFFIVRPRPGAQTGTILYKKSTLTRHAYNHSNNADQRRESNLYENPIYLVPHEPDEPIGHRVSFHRPGGIIDLAYWDAPFIGWLASNGYAVDFCTDVDLHEDPEMLSAYRLLLSVGHDEYWTSAMREHTERFIADGGNVAFLSGNTCWWRAHLVDGNTAMVVDTDHHVGNVYPHLPATDQWWAPEPAGVGRPENSLTGVSFRNGGMWPGDWPGDRPLTGFAVQHADHWVFAGTGLRDGTDGDPQDRLGAGTPLIGYECDGAAFRYDEDGIARAEGIDGTPESFLILGLALLEPVNDDYHDMHLSHWNCPDREAGITSPRAATMGIYTANGTVFTSATTDWPMIVGNRLDADVEQVTRNLLDRLAT